MEVMDVMDVMVSEDEDNEWKACELQLQSLGRTCRELNEKEADRGSLTQPICEKARISGLRQERAR